MKREIKILIGGIAGIQVCQAAAGALLLGGAGVYFLKTAPGSSAQYFITVSELLDSKDRLVDREITLSGAVLGNTILVDDDHTGVTFYIADVPGTFAEVEEQGGLAAVLDTAVNDPDRPKIQILYPGPKPELLRDGAQAVMTGRLSPDGVFNAAEVLLKCPSRYEEAIPDQAVD